MISGLNTRPNFVGTWHYGSEYKETNIVITKDNTSGLYHINISDKAISMGDKEFKPSLSMEGKATSDNVLEIIGPSSVMVPELSLKNNKLTMRNGNTYDKVK